MEEFKRYSIMLGYSYYLQDHSQYLRDTPIISETRHSLMAVSCLTDNETVGAKMGFCLTDNETASHKY
jgi:hypothetical protein